MPRGYDRPLYILPFDHRGSFQSKLFGWKAPLSEEQTAEIAAANVRFHRICGWPDKFLGFTSRLVSQEGDPR